MKLIAGVDEAGRGALAGPVVAAAVILPDEYDLVGLNDSKKVSPLKREKLFAKITNQAISIGVGIVSHYEIDKINILESTFKAMKMALGKLKPFPDEALIDGFPLKTQIIPNRGIIKGDEKIDVIKAASIIAKVTRDTIMIEYDTEYPLYAFKKHKGYGTKEHIELLQRYKPCEIHRKTFKPVSSIL
ncbi:MAG: ribonuclease HII [Candidatus Neomarinimicrobiota bacterium]